MVEGSPTCPLLLRQKSMSTFQRTKTVQTMGETQDASAMHVLDIVSPDPLQKHMPKRMATRIP